MMNHELGKIDVEVTQARKFRRPGNAHPPDVIDKHMVAGKNQKSARAATRTDDVLIIIEKRFVVLVPCNRTCLQDDLGVLIAG